MDPSPGMFGDRITFLRFLFPNFLTCLIQQNPKAMVSYTWTPPKPMENQPLYLLAGTYSPLTVSSSHVSRELDEEISADLADEVRKTPPLPKPSHSMSGPTPL